MFGRVKVKGFVTYPDTATNGRKNRVIQVEEILDSGKTATYNYTVPFVVSSKLEVTAKSDNKVLLRNRHEHSGSSSVCRCRGGWRKA